jgi:hypothetical protein
MSRGEYPPFNRRSKIGPGSPRNWHGNRHSEREFRDRRFGRFGFDPNSSDPERDEEMYHMYKMGRFDPNSSDPERDEEMYHMYKMGRFDPKS